MYVKYNISAVKAGNGENFDLEINIEGVPSYIELKTSPNVFNSSSMMKFKEEIRMSEYSVYLVYLLKDNQQSRNVLLRQVNRMMGGELVENLKIVLFEDFLCDLFGRDEAKQFKKAMVTYKDEMHRAIGYQITEMFNTHNFEVLKDELNVEFRL